MQSVYARIYAKHEHGRNIRYKNPSEYLVMKKSPVTEMKNTAIKFRSFCI